MADPFAQLGISRRPAYEMFGTPDISRGGWSQGTRQAVLADRAALDEAQAQQDEREARDRERAAERAADEFVQAQPSARERFLSERPEIVGSKRFNEIAAFQQMQPSYADNRLKNTVAMKIAEPEARKVFLDAVAAGHGTLAAQDMANTFLAKRKAAGELGKAGYSPEEAEKLVAERHDPAHVNYHVTQKKGETLFGKDPEAQALEKYYSVLKDRAGMEMKDLTGNGLPSAETSAEMKRVAQELGDRYKIKAYPGGIGTVLRPTTPAAASPTTAAPVPLKDTLKSMATPAASGNAPMPAVTPAAPVAAPEEIASAQDEFENSPEADENYFSARIADPNTPLAKKQELLGKFRNYVQNPKPNPSLTLPQLLARRETLKQQLAEAEDEVQFQPEREKFNQAWTDSKGTIDQMVDRFAKRMGVSKQNVINSLVAGDRIDIPGKTRRSEAGVTIPQLLAEEWATDHPEEVARLGLSGAHQLWSAEAPQLAPFKNSPYASRLGTKVGPVPVRQTFGDVLDAYVADQKAQTLTGEAATPTSLPRPATPAEAAKLPPGTQFLDPSGTIRMVPTK